MSDEHEDYGPQLPDARDLYRARERVLEADQAGGNRTGVTQAQASAERTETAFIQAEDRRMEDPGYRAEVQASYDGDRYAEMEGGAVTERQADAGQRIVTDRLRPRANPAIRSCRPHRRLPIPRSSRAGQTRTRRRDRNRVSHQERGVSTSAGAAFHCPGWPQHRAPEASGADPVTQGRGGSVLVGCRV